mmetsp:Transcript_67249/g.187660  ORF Transcript_67249/g.187660 Transcript_67249/m.187660 type:complete len:200 (+) Transcript_67249:659-1258(+)
MLALSPAALRSVEQDGNCDQFSLGEDDLAVDGDIGNLERLLDRSSPREPLEGLLEYPSLAEVPPRIASRGDSAKRCHGGEGDEASLLSPPPWGAGECAVRVLSAGGPGVEGVGDRDRGGAAAATWSMSRRNSVFGKHGSSTATRNFSKATRCEGPAAEETGVTVSLAAAACTDKKGIVDTDRTSRASRRDFKSWFCWVS